MTQLSEALVFVFALFMMFLVCFYISSCQTTKTCRNVCVPGEECVRYCQVDEELSVDPVGG